MAAVRRVLVLHGYSQNASIMRKRLGALRKECGKDIELVFVDGPQILQPVDLAGMASQTTLDQLGAAEAMVTETPADPALTPRAWWKSNAERTKCYGLEETLIYLRDILSGQKFDGVFGFSQGAALAALLAALLERPHVFPPFLIEGQPPHPPLQFCVAVSGFAPKDPIAGLCFSPPFSTPTLHVLGRTDIIVTEERSRTLIEVSANARVEEHDGGHFVPSKTNWRKFICDYMRDPKGDRPSPSSSGGSGANSGTSTPTMAGLIGDSALMMKL